MQTRSLAFRRLEAGNVRPLSWQLRASFDKMFDDSVDFFTLDTSLLDGVDKLAPSDNNVIAEWDKYLYIDYSSRVISLEVTKEIHEPYSIVQSYADVTLNNYDSYFTPDSGSPIDMYILPRRPFRILMGFGNETVPSFIGLSEKMPDINKADRTATFHLIDFLTLIMERNVDESSMLLDYTTSEILDVLFQHVGLLPSQYILDTSFNRIPYFFVEKGESLQTIIQGLMEAEQGRLYMDALGIIRFQNRQNYNDSIVFDFDKSNVIDYSGSTEDDIINSVKLTADILGVQGSQSVWQQSQVSEKIEPGDSIEIWADLNDPATSVDTPTYSASVIAASYFKTTTDIEGTTPYTSVTLSDFDVFGTSVKMTFTNSGGTRAYVYALDLWGTPVQVVDTILVEDSDPTSVAEFEEHVYEFETKYIQTEDNAIQKAAILIDDYKDYGSLVDLDTKGTPALQLGDAVNIDLDGYQGPHIVTKKVEVMADGKFSQSLRAKARTVRSYFILDESLLDGEDVLGL